MYKLFNEFSPSRSKYKRHVLLKVLHQNRIVAFQLYTGETSSLFVQPQWILSDNIRRLDKVNVFQCYFTKKKKNILFLKKIYTFKRVSQFKIFEHKKWLKKYQKKNNYNIVKLNMIFFWFV